MAVPAEVRAVPRPVNTVVEDTGNEGPKRFAVRARRSVKYTPNGNPQPIKGKTIGYIYDGKFVPKQSDTDSSGTIELSYGSSQLIYEQAKDVFEDLLAVYPVNDAITVLSLAAVKVMRPRISGSRIAGAYASSYISKLYAGADLSENSISELYKSLGEDAEKRTKFYDLRVARVEKDHHVAIDGTLKQDTGKVTDLSGFSYKARLRGCEDLSILYAYDLERMEPICSEVFPGNGIDAASYKEFIRENSLTGGIILDDKGFPLNPIRKELGERPDLHYLTPVKRNDSRIKTLGLLQFDSVVSGIDKLVQCSRKKTEDGLFLYAFRDQGKASQEEHSYLENAKKKDNYRHEDFEKKRPGFGAMVLESDLDLDMKSVYLCYEDRWKIELVFKAYRSDEGLDRTPVQGDYSIYGSEFVNFISTLLTCRIISKAARAGVLEEITYRDMMEDLNAAWRKYPVPAEVIPATNDNYWIHTIGTAFDVLEKLGLSQPAAKPEPARRGRKPGSKTNKEEKDQPKQPAGRPRKTPPRDPDTPKRPVGRPRKKPPKDPNAPKRPVGRPRTKPLPDPNAPKRPVGRPRKEEAF